MGFLISPVEKLFLVLTQEYFWKFYIFPRESGSPNRGTETGCLFCLEHLSVPKKCFGQVIPFPKSQTHVHNKASEPQETYNHIWTKQNLNRTILYFSKPYLNINTRFFQLLTKCSLYDFPFYIQTWTKYIATFSKLTPFPRSQCYNGF